MKRYRFPIILVVVIAALAGVAYWDEWKTKQEEQQDKSKNKLADFKSDDVTKIELSSAGADAAAAPVKLTLEKAGEAWSMVEPLRTPADQSAVKNLLQALTDYKYETKVTDDKSKMAQYGLEQPRRTITLTMGKDKTLTVMVGAKAQVGFSSYVSTSASSDIYIGSQHIDTAMDKKPADFRDRSLVAVRGDEVIEFNFQNAKTAVTVARKSPQDPFKITKPRDMDADSDTLNDFISAIGSEKVEDFVDAPDAKITAALKSPKRLGTISWQLANGEKQQLDFAELNGKLYVRSEAKQAVFTVNTSFKAKMEKDLASFQDKTVIKFKSEDITQVEVDGDVFVKNKDNWVKKDDKDAKPVNHIRSLVTDLEFAKAQRFVDIKDIKAITSAAPKHKIKMVFAETTKRPEVVIEGWPDAKNPERWYLKHSDHIGLFEVRPGIFANASAEGPGSTAQPQSPATLGEPPVNLQENMGAPEE